MGCAMTYGAAQLYPRHDRYINLFDPMPNFSAYLPAIVIERSCGSRIQLAVAALVTAAAQRKFLCEGTVVRRTRAQAECDYVGSRWPYI